MNRNRIAARSLLAALMLIASIAIVASPASASAPTSSGTNPTTSENTAVSGTVTFAATDGWVEVDSGVPTNVTGGTVSSFTYTPADRFSLTSVTMDYTFTPTTNFSGTASFQVQASGMLGETTTHTESITVTAADSPATWNTPSHTTGEGQPVSGSVTFNDPDNTFGSGGILTQATNGTAVTTSVTGTGTNTMTVNYTYTPTTGYSGGDSFVVGYSSGVTLAGPTVNVTVDANSGPVASDVPVSTPEDTAVNIDLSTGVTDANDTTHTYTLSAAGGPTNGTLGTLVGSSVTYTPNTNYAGTDSLGYAVCDDQNACAGGTVNITISNVADAPVVTGVNPTIDEDTSTAFQIISGTDPDGGAMNAPMLTTAPSQSTFFYGEGFTSGTTSEFEYYYHPNANFNGTDTFQVTFTDDNGGTTVHTETITVTAINDAPVANNGSYNGNAGATITGTMTATDVDAGATLSYDIVAQAGQGNVVIDDPWTGDFTYTATAGASGTDTFTFVANDGTVDSNVATITLNVNGAPVASDVSRNTDEDTSLSILLGGITADPDNADNELTYSITSGPANGTVTEILDPTTGRVDYTPNANYFGSDSITYQACDPASLCDTGVITITVNPVNDAPVAADGTVTTAEDTPANGITPVTDIDDTDHTFAEATAPTNGTLDLDAVTGEWTYTPEADFTGPDSFTLEVCDAGPLCATSTVTVTVTVVNDGPAASDADATTNEDTATSGTVEVTDVDDTTFTFAIATQAMHGTASVNATTGAWTYIPHGGFGGSDTFTVKVCDPGDLCDTATVNVTVNPVNDGPTAADLTVTTDEDTAVQGTVSVTDPDDISFTFEVTAGPGNGTPEIDRVTGEFTYTPDADWHGTDSFTVEVCDPSGACNTSTVTVTVEPVNDPPAADTAGDGIAGADQTAEVGTPVNLTAGTVTDPEGDDLTYTWTQTGGPAVTLEGTGTTDGPAVAFARAGTMHATFTPTEAGVHTFMLTVCDENGMCVTDAMTVDVLGAVVEQSAPLVPTTPVAPVPAAAAALTRIGSTLARTGSPAMPLVSGALALLLAGFALTRMSRKES